MDSFVQATQIGVRCNQPRQRTYCSYTCGVGSPVSVVSTLTGHAGGSASPDSTQAA